MGLLGLHMLLCILWGLRYVLKALLNQVELAAGQSSAEPRQWRGSRLSEPISPAGQARSAEGTSEVTASHGCIKTAGGASKALSCCVPSVLYLSAKGLLRPSTFRRPYQGSVPQSCAGSRTGGGSHPDGHRFEYRDPGANRLFDIVYPGTWAARRDSP